MAERKNRTLLEAACTILISSGLSPKLWTEAVRTANYLQNRSSTKALAKSTPYEMLHGKKPDLRHLRIIGCKAYVLLPRTQQTKLSAKALCTSLLGYDDCSKAYRCFDPVGNRIIISRDVTFDESQKGPVKNPSSSNLLDFLFQSTDTDIAPIPLAQPNNPIEPIGPEREIPISGELGPVARELDPIPPNIDQIEVPLAAEPLAEPELRPTATRHSLRQHRPPPWHADYKMSTFLVESSSPECENLTVDQALKHPGWSQAMQEEIDSLTKMATWELVYLPAGRRALTAKWVFRTKPDSTRFRLKARLVARGFEQKYDIDYNETFAPVVKWSTLRAIIALAVANGLELHHMDVVTAFLNGTLTEEIYMQQPQGFEVPGKESMVCRLRRSLYGLKQAPRAWYEEIDSHLTSTGWTRSLADPNLYFCHKNGHISIIMLYVDDLLITGSDSNQIAAVKSHLRNRYHMKDLQLAQKYLGIEFCRTPTGLILHQSAYCEALVEEFGMRDSRVEHIPLPEGHTLTSETGTPSVDTTEYCHAVGKLIFLTHTRPDITYAVGVVSRYMAHPQQQHWESVKHILRYLKGTTSLGINFQRSHAPATLQCFTDADFLGCPETRRSRGAYLLQFSNGPISWSSKLQSTVSDSTTEAEYKALSEGAKEAVHLRRLLLEIATHKVLPVPISLSNTSIHANLALAHSPTELDLHLHCDNQGSIKLAKNPIFHARTKHIEGKHHFIRERVLEGEITLSYINTNENPADLLTKPLSRIKFEKHQNFIGIKSTLDTQALS